MCCKNKFVHSKDFLISLFYDLNTVFYENNSSYDDFISIKNIEIVDGLFEKVECLRLSKIRGEIDSDETLLTKVQTNILESEKINEPSSEINSTLLSVVKAKDSDGSSKDTEETSLIAPKVTSPSVETSLAKNHDKNKTAIENESLINSQTDNTEHILSKVQTNTLDSEKMDVPSSAINSSNLSVEEGKDSATELLARSEEFCVRTQNS